MNIQEKVKNRYGKIASSISTKKQSNCCSDSSCCKKTITDLSVNYAGTELSVIPKEAVEASLGCANPIVFAQLKEGETVLDLGSGGGLDVLMAARLVGESGKVYGLDMTDEMLNLANENKDKMGISNVEFLKGYIENIPLPDESVDVVLSNCVINLSEDKEKALSEAYRIIKRGGRLRIADMVTIKEVSHKIRKSAELWCGCIAGTLTIDEYKNILQKCGFNNIQIEIAHVYNKDIIRSEFGAHDSGETGLTDAEFEAVDGAFAGALVRADK